MCSQVSCRRANVNDGQAIKFTTLCRTRISEGHTSGQPLYSGPPMPKQSSSMLQSPLELFAKLKSPTAGMHNLRAEARASTGQFARDLQLSFPRLPQPRFPAPKLQPM